MSIGLFIDAAYVWKVFREHTDYLKLRLFIEKELGDTVDDGYFFNADSDPPKAEKLHNALTFPPSERARTTCQDLLAIKKATILAQSSGRTTSAASRYSRPSI